MSVGESGIETVPEVRGDRGADRGTAMLLIASFAERGAKAVRVDGGLIIGRDRPGADQGADYVQLPDRLLSRRHLGVSGRQGGYNVEDLGSLNGSYLDGRRLVKPASLSEGCILLFGNHVGVFRRVSEAESVALAEESASPFGPVATLSPSFALTLAKLRRLAVTDNELLLVGEAGIDKEAYARAIHRASGRKGPFVSINCGSLPAELVERELFGAVSDARRKAIKASPGLVEAAEGGTLFLDEINNVPLDVQGKIVRLLQDPLITARDSTSARRSDVRVLAATSWLGAGSASGPLRSDLVARLGADPIRIPPLRERPEDIGPLAWHFAAGAVREVAPAAFRALCLHAWPLNVRELDKAIKHALALSPDRAISLESLPSTIGGVSDPAGALSPRRRKRPAPARSELEQLLRQHHGNVSGVARSLDRKWTVVWRWMARHELRPEQFRQ